MVHLDGKICQNQAAKCFCPNCTTDAIYNLWIFETMKDFEFDEKILDKWIEQSKSSDGPDIESMEFIFDVIIKKMPPAVQLPFLAMKR